MNKYKDITYPNSFIPQDVTVKVGDDLSVNNYKQGILANLYSVGSTITLEFSGYTKVYKLEDEDLIHDFRIVQLEYALYGKSFINKKGNTVREYSGLGSGSLKGFYKDLLESEFGDRQVAKDYYTSKSFNALKAALPSKYDLLDVMAEDLVDSYNDWVTKATLRQSLMDLAPIKTQMYKLGLKEAELPEVPRNDVTARESVVSFKTVKVTDKVYVNSNNKYQVLYAEAFEAKVVDAWYNKRMEFRVPTLDEQINEYLVLEEWFAQYKAHARATRMAWISQSDIEMFERYEELQVQVSHYLDDVNPEWV